MRGIAHASRKTLQANADAGAKHSPVRRGVWGGVCCHSGLSLKNSESASSSPRHVRIWFSWLHFRGKQSFPLRWSDGELNPAIAVTALP